MAHHPGDLDLQYVEASGRTVAFRATGPSDGRPILLVHGWPQSSWAWRHQLVDLAQRGYRVIAPDLRGVGASSTYSSHSDYALRHHVGDLIALLDALGVERATWVGHDWGAPIVWAALRHHPERFSAAGSISTPYDTLEKGFEQVTAFVRRDVYPEDEYPAGQMDYYRFYSEDFAAAQSHFEADVPAFFTAILRGDAPHQEDVVWPTATVRRRGGWFDGGPAPRMEIDRTVIDDNDLRQFVEEYSRTGFFGTNSFYMNDDDNRAFVAEAGDSLITIPTLLIIGGHDYVNDAAYSDLAEPMRAACRNLDERVVGAAHWIHQERPEEVNNAIADLADRGAAWPLS